MGPEVELGQTTRRMSISESISHFLSISSPSPRPSGCEPSFSASAVARSYSSPLSCSEVSRPLRSSKPVVDFRSMHAGTLSTLLRNLSFSSGVYFASRDCEEWRRKLCRTNVRYGLTDSSQYCISSRDMLFRCWLMVFETSA